MLVHFALDLGREVVVGDQGQDRDQQPCRRRDERFGHAAGHRVRLAHARFGHDIEGADHADHRAEQAEQGRQGDDRVEHTEAAFQHGNLRLSGGFHRLRRRGIAVRDARR